MIRKLNDSTTALERKKIKTNTSLERDFMSYNSVLSLERIATVKVATVLSKQSDISHAILQHSLKFYPLDCTVYFSRTWKEKSIYEIEKITLKKLSLLPLPNLLKVKVSNIIRPIILQILGWIRNDKELIDSICWTNEGTIDKTKTLKQLIDKAAGQLIHGIYKLACMHCLEESIPNLWDRLSNERKEEFRNSERIYSKYDNHLIAYWTSAVNNKLFGLISKIKPSDYNDIYNCNHSLYKNMFTLALSEGNSSAVKYFWNKLTDEEKSNNLTQWVNDVVHRRKNKVWRYENINQYAYILYYLLSKMNDKEQQGEVLRKNCDVILNSLFHDWPLQIHLLPTIRRMWSFLDEKVYVTLLNNIACQIKEGKTTEQIFSSLWYDSPVNLKKNFIQHVLNDSRGTDVICNLLIVKDIGTIKAILDYANVEECKKIIFSLIENSNLFEVIYADRLPLFGILIEVLSESDINRIKERIAFKHGDKLCYEWIISNKWKMVDEFLNWAFASQDQIDEFKNKTINKIEITYSLLTGDKYESVNKFISWCFHSEEEINQFKKYFAKSKPEIVGICCDKEWHSLDKIIEWCFDSEQEIRDFKSNVLQSSKVQGIIIDTIVYGYDFEFTDQLISWCCHSPEEIQQYKAEFVLSEDWIIILQRFVTNYKIYDSEWNNWELIKKLVKLFSPLEEAIITNLKKKIATSIDFDSFYPDFRNCSYRIDQKDLFRLLDNDSYNIDDESCTDSDNDSDPDTCNNYDENPSTVLQVLNDMLNRVKNGLLEQNSP